MILDSGQRTEFNSGAVRDMHEGKGRCDLLPMCVLLRLARHYENGCKKYGPRNWERGIPASSFLDSALRHIYKYADGMNDEDHLISALWNLCGLAWTEEKKPECMDIPARMSQQKNPEPCQQKTVESGQQKKAEQESRTAERIMTMPAERAASRTAEGLRPCWVYTETSGDVTAERAVFHRWMTLATQIAVANNLPLYAVVEYEDGIVRAVPAGCIQFADKIDFDGFQWQEPFHGGGDE